MSHDEVSLGNTSDNLEAVSEAASNHSVTSSLELETEDQNDNLSDMVIFTFRFSSSTNREQKSFKLIYKRNCFLLAIICS